MEHVNAENLTFIGVVGGVIIGFGRWLTGILVKPLVKRIEELEKKNPALDKVLSEMEKGDELRDKSMVELASFEQKNADAIVDLSGRIGRIDERVVSAANVSADNKVEMALHSSQMDQFSKEKTKLFDKTDILEEGCGQIKERLARLEK